MMRTTVIVLRGCLAFLHGVGMAAGLALWVMSRFANPPVSALELVAFFFGGPLLVAVVTGVAWWAIGMTFPAIRTRGPAADGQG